MYEYYEKRVYELKDHDASDYNKAMNKIREWDYNKDAPIGLGVFYKKDAPSFGDDFSVPGISEPERSAKIKKIMEESV